MKKILVPVAMIVALGAIIAASFFSGRDSRKGAEVDLESPERRTIAQTIKASGQVDPRIKVNISAHVIGKIERLFVEEGDEVKAGDAFLMLEQEAFLAIRNRARAQVEIARSQLRQGEINLEDAEIRLRRAERLSAERVLAQEGLEQSQLAQKSAELQLEQAREGMRQAEADLEKAQDDLEKTTIYSPLTGRVIALNAEEGEVVVSGTMNNPASVIGTVADLSEILVEVDVDENEIVDVQLGQIGVAEVDAIPEHEYVGRVVEIGSSGFNKPTQPDVTFFKVKVLLDAPDDRLRAGMSARTEIQIDEHNDALVVPIQAVLFRNAEGKRISGEEDEQRVVFVEDGDTARAVPVEIGISDETHIEILNWSEGEDAKVVVGPYRELRSLESDDAIRERDDKKGGPEGDDSE